MTACSPRTPCTHGHFCDEHFGLCLPTRPVGQYCRRDTHCAHGLLCMFGKCQQPVPDGQEGEQGVCDGVWGRGMQRTDPHSPVPPPPQPQPWELGDTMLTGWALTSAVTPTPWR